jgi:HEAT repeats
MRRLRSIALLVFAIGIAALIITLTLSTHRDPRLERLIGWHTFRKLREAAIEREVVEAELASYGPELIPALRQELDGGSVWRTKLAQFIELRSPAFIAESIGQKHIDSDRRRGLAALCLGRIGPRASTAIPDLKRLAGSGGELGLTAEIALAMIARQDPTVQSNAVAALASTSQPRRFFFMRHADEIWPGRTDLFINSLNDEDQAVRANAAQALGHAGSSASNATSLLIPMLADRSVIVRPKAAFALGQIAPEFAEIAVASMIDQRKTNFSWTGDCAYVLYQTVGPKANAAIPTLESDLSDTNMRMFHGDVAAALWRITGTLSPAMADGLNTTLQIGVQRMQIRCLRIVKEIGPPAAATIPELRRMTNHPLILIRRLAGEALESVDHTGNSQTNHLNAP